MENEKILTIKLSNPNTSIRMFFLTFYFFRSEPLWELLEHFPCVCILPSTFYILLESFHGIIRNRHLETACENRMGLNKRVRMPSRHIWFLNWKKSKYLKGPETCIPRNRKGHLAKNKRCSEMLTATVKLGANSSKWNHFVNENKREQKSSIFQFRKATKGVQRRLGNGISSNWKHQKNFYENLSLKVA